MQLLLEMLVRNELPSTSHKRKLNEYFYDKINTVLVLIVSKSWPFSDTVVFYCI